MPNDDLTTNVHADLGWYIEKYFQRSDTAEFRDRTVMAGAYVDGGNASFSEFGVSRQVDYKLNIGNTDVEGNGSNLSSISLASGNVESMGLLELKQLADPVVDTPAAIRAVLAPYQDEAEDWANAIASGDRANLYGRTLADVTAVPSGSPTQELVMLHALLRRHFSYDDQGRYVAKWSGSGRTFPADTIAAYRQAQVVEHKLPRGQFYVMTILPEAQQTGSQPVATEAVYQLRRVDDELVVSDPVYSVRRVEDAPRNEFVFFYAASGTNIEVPEAARGTLTPELAEMLAIEGTSGISLMRDDDSWILEQDKIKLTALVAEDAALSNLPDGVELLEEDDLPDGNDGIADSDDGDEDALADALQDDLRVLLCPPDKLVELAANPNIRSIRRVSRCELHMDQALPRINHPAYITALGADGGGEGVVVGIVDSGIDPAHPAFTNRIEKVWDQTTGLSTTHPPPSGSGYNFGQVYDTWAEITANSIDDHGHGTHVAGIAAGAASGAYTRNGTAPKATIIFVRTDLDPEHVTRGVEWIFREAGNRPCVVNLSLGGIRAGHDGVDDFALMIRRTFRRPNSSGGGYTWLRKRAVCIAAGNARQGRWHAQIDSIDHGATAQMPFRIADWSGAVGTPFPVPSARFELYIRPIPDHVYGGVRVGVRVRPAAGAGAAAISWCTYDPAGTAVVNHWPVTTGGFDIVGVTNGPPPPGDHRGLIYTQHQLISISMISTNPSLAFADYVIEVRNDGPHPVEVHGYRAFLIPPPTNRVIHTAGAHPVFFTNATERCQVNTPAVAYGVLSVGASVNRTTWTKLGGSPTVPADQFANDNRVYDPATNFRTNATTPSAVGEVAQFSSTGPMRGTRRTLTTNAPGSGIFSARSSHPSAYPAAAYGPNYVNDHGQDALTIEMSGTSMACPMVAGVAACLFEKHPTLTARDVGRRIRDAHTTPTGWDTDADGPGQLDCSKIVV